jgi:hypothetical protein
MLGLTCGRVDRVPYQEDGELNIARTPADVWAIDVEGLWAENGPDGWWIISRPIGPDRLTLAERDVAPVRPGQRDARARVPRVR